MYFFVGYDFSLRTRTRRRRRKKMRQKIEWIIRQHLWTMPTAYVVLRYVTLRSCVRHFPDNTRPGPARLRMESDKFPPRPETKNRASESNNNTKSIMWNLHTIKPSFFTTESWLLWAFLPSIWNCGNMRLFSLAQMFRLWRWMVTHHHHHHHRRAQSRSNEKKKKKKKNTVGNRYLSSVVGLFAQEHMFDQFDQFWETTIFWRNLPLPKLTH